MLLAKPLEVFTLKDRRIVTCTVSGCNANEFVNKELWFRSGETRKRIRVQGISTASDTVHDAYDFHYTGAAILPEEICGGAIITDAKE